MFKIDQAIKDTNAVICKNIARFDSTERGLLSQNILGQLRNFVEYIISKIIHHPNDVDPNNFGLKEQAISQIKTMGQYRFINKFHDLLQKSVSHYTADEDGSERLMLKYYEYLLKLKILLKNDYSIDVLENIEDFPLDTDEHFQEYYEKIAEKINLYTGQRCNYDDRCYIHKIKPFFVEERIYYEVTFTIANDNVSKFDRQIAFTEHELIDNYSVKLALKNDTIDIKGHTLPIQIIDNWQISIRPCELEKFAKIVGESSSIKSNHKEYLSLMNFLTSTKINLLELVLLSTNRYNKIKEKLLEQAKTVSFFNALDKCRNIILNHLPGANTLRYLLYKLNNKMLKNQLSKENCEKLSNLNLNYGCLIFENMPFASSLIHHNPKLRDLIFCIDDKNREYEFFARKIRNNTEHQGMLFTPATDLDSFGNIDSLMSQYNDHVYYKHLGRKIKKYKDFFYISEYADDSAEIIKKLLELTQSSIGGYRASVESWLRNYYIDCDEKKEAILRLFENSSVAIIYGAAGTGKSTLINHISNFFSDKDKIYLANTHPAVENMHRKVKTANCEFKTIKSFLSDNNDHFECDILVIDECSTVSNHDMRMVIEKAKFDLLILVGDVYQIESIMFGNWFSIANTFVPTKAIVELNHPYRTKNNELLAVWDRVRNLDIAILEPLVKNKYSQELNDSLFEHNEKDEIILCLNYDGLYGINNINRFLQGSNNNPAIEWGVSTYKIGDRILFNESKRFAPLIYNNMKGEIRNIKIEDNRIWFEIELEIAINELDAKGYAFSLLGLSESGNSVIGFWVDNYKSTDNDDDSLSSIVPFQVAYAVSIHKAQGLEYKSVKIVITNEIEELISHNIFYTAITRAKEELKIYWTPETEQYVLKSLKRKDNKRDAAILKTIYEL